MNKFFEEHFSKPREINPSSSLIDIERLKREISIESLIAQEFTVTGSGRTKTTEEHDSLKIFSDTNSWSWYSRDGNGGKNLGGSVIDWYMHRHSCTVAEAIQALAAMVNGGSITRLPTPAVIERKAAKKEAALWQHPKWQTMALDYIRYSSEILWNKDEGAEGREYLKDRKITDETARLYSSGWMPTFMDCPYSEWGLAIEGNMVLKKGLVIPWFLDDKITVIKTRQPVSELRYKYICVDGSEHHLFGTQNLFNTSVSKPLALIVVEGEINCLSVAQVIRENGLHIDVVSVGAQGVNDNAKAMIKKLAPNYRHHAAWADKTKAAEAILSCLPVGALRVTSPKMNGVEYDANELLKAGRLENFIWKIIEQLSKG